MTDDARTQLWLALAQAREQVLARLRKKFPYRSDADIEEACDKVFSRFEVLVARGDAQALRKVPTSLSTLLDYVIRELNRPGTKVARLPKDMLDEHWEALDQLTGLVDEQITVRSKARRFPNVAPDAMHDYNRPELTVTLFYQKHLGVMFRGWPNVTLDQMNKKMHTDENKLLLEYRDQLPPALSDKQEQLFLYGVFRIIWDSLTGPAKCRTLTRYHRSQPISGDQPRPEQATADIDIELQDWISKLTDDEQRLWKLKAEDGLNHESIKAQTGWTDNKIRQLLKSIRSKCQEPREPE